MNVNEYISLRIYSLMLKFGQGHHCFGDGQELRFEFFDLGLLCLNYVSFLKKFRLTNIYIFVSILIKMDFNKLKIFEGQSWDVFLHKDQTSIGKLYFWYKNNTNDLLEVPSEELLEFQNIGNKIKSSLEKLFSPDMYNYLSLNNATTHLHIHMIPRYSKQINLFGYVFNDVNFGKEYLCNSEFNVDEETLIQITNLIKNEL